MHLSASIEPGGEMLKSWPQNIFKSLQSFRPLPSMSHCVGGGKKTNKKTPNPKGSLRKKHESAFMPQTGQVGRFSEASPSEVFRLEGDKSSQNFHLWKIEAEQLLRKKYREDQQFAKRELLPK